MECMWTVLTLEPFGVLKLSGGLSCWHVFGSCFYVIAFVFHAQARRSVRLIGFVCSVGWWLVSVWAWCTRCRTPARRLVRCGVTMATSFFYLSDAVNTR